MKNVKIEDVALICRGASPRPIIDYITKKDDGVNWIKIGDVDDDSIYINKTEEKITNEGALKSRFVKKGDFILSNSMSFGRPYILNIDGCVHDGWLILSDYEKFMLQKYFYYVLKSNNTQEQFVKTAQGATVKNLNSDIVRKTSIKIYDFPKQQKIVSTLDKINAIIDSDKKQLKLLDEMIKSRFIEMFKDDLKEKTNRLSDLCEVITKGTTPTTLGFDFVEEGVNFVKIECITETYEFLIDKMLHITSECDEKLKRSKLKENDVLFSIAGAIGRTAIVSKDILPANTNQALAIIRLKKDSGLNVIFLNEMLHTELITEQVDGKKNGVAQTNLSLTDIGNLNVIVPSMEKQLKFESFVNLIDKLKFNVQQHLNLMQELLDKKMEEFFGGVE